MTDNSTDTEGGADEPVARPFADFLVELRRGAVHEEITAALHELIERVQTTGKAGAITLTIKASLQKKTDMLTIADSVGRKLPVVERPESLWFVDPDGNPTRRDPHQLEFEGIRVVTPTPAKKTSGEAKHA